MGENYGWNNINHKVGVPAFGKWDYGYDEGEEDYEDMPYTQCFEVARQSGFVRYATYAQALDHEQKERDLYDLHQNDVVTPAFIVLPRPSTMRKSGLCYQNVKGEGKKQKEEWGGYSYNNSNNNISSYEYKIKMKKPTISIPTNSKPVDEDLYKIPSDFLYVKPKRKPWGLGLFSSCLMPACV